MLRKRNRPKNHWLRTGLLLGLALLVSYPSTAAADEPKTLIVAIEANMPGFDGHVICSYALYREIITMYEPLVTTDLTDPDAIPPKLVPALAERWETSPDATEVTFHIRKGVKFHDGTEVDANVVDWNFRRVWRKGEGEEAPQYYAAAAGPASFWADSVADVQVVDTHTIKVFLKHPFPEFARQLYATTCGSFFVVSPSAVEKHGQEGLAKNPVGTGPFKFVEWVPGDRIVVERFDGYWGAPPKVDRIVFREFTNMAAMVAGFRRGELDIIPAVPPDNIALLREDGFNVATNLVPNMIYFVLNLKDPVLADIRVRRAMAMAIDKETLAKKLLTDAAEAAHSIVSPGSPPYDPEFRSLAHDLEKAKALMQEAGYGPDNRVTMHMPNPASGSGTIAPVPIALALQSNLSKIYIDLKVETLEWYGFISLLSRGLQPDAQILPMPWGMSTGFWVRQILHSKKQPFSNYGWYVNPEVDRLLDEATSTPDLEKSKELFAQINQIVVNEDVAVIPGLIDLSPTAYQPYVKNFVLPHENWFVLHEVDIER
jgi:peptide/nickel transport system substrate-binding protein